MIPLLSSSQSGAACSRRSVGPVRPASPILHAARPPAGVQRNVPETIIRWSPRRPPEPREQQQLRCTSAPRVTPGPPLHHLLTISVGIAAACGTMCCAPAWASAIASAQPPAQVSPQPCACRVTACGLCKTHGALHDTARTRCSQRAEFALHACMMQVKNQSRAFTQQRHPAVVNPVAEVAGLFGSGSSDPTDPFTLYGTVRWTYCASDRLRAGLLYTACVRVRSGDVS